MCTFCSLLLLLVKSKRDRDWDIICLLYIVLTADQQKDCNCSTLTLNNYCCSEWYCNYEVCVMMSGRILSFQGSSYFNDIQNLFVKAVLSVERSIGSVHNICKSLLQGLSHGETEFIIEGIVHFSPSGLFTHHSTFRNHFLYFRLNNINTSTICIREACAAVSVQKIVNPWFSAVF